MPPATRFQSFLIVFTLLCLAAIALVILDEFTGYEWVRRVVSIGQNLSNLFFTAVAVTFIAVEGGPLMLAAWLKKAHIKEAEEKARATGREEGRAEGRTEGRAEGRTEGRAEGRAEGNAAILAALRNMQPGDTVEDAIARLEKGLGKSDNHQG